MKHRLLLLAAPLLCASCASRPAEGPPPADAGVRAAARMPTPPPPAEWFAENERALDLGGGVRMRMLPVPAGVFRMGSPRSEYGRPLGGPAAAVPAQRRAELLRGRLARQRPRLPPRPRAEAAARRGREPRPVHQSLARPEKVSVPP